MARALSCNDLVMHSREDQIVSIMPERWDIRREGRAWDHAEKWDRWNRLPEKFEVDEGKLFFEDDQRINLLGALLENVGADRAVQLGQIRVWAEAVKAQQRKRFFGDRFTRTMTLMMGLHVVTLIGVLWWRLPLPMQQQRLMDLLMAAAVSYAVALGVHIFLQE